LGIPESAIGKGHHTLAIKVLTKDQKAYYSSEGSVSFETR
jgi:hypothetical protein